MKAYNFVLKLIIFDFQVLNVTLIFLKIIFVSSIILWNKCISKLLDNPDLLSLSHRSHLIIPGHNANSDLTIPIGTFKNRLKNFLLKTQNLGITSDWSQVSTLNCQSIGHCANKWGTVSYSASQSGQRG